MENIGFDGSGTHYVENIAGHKSEMYKTRITDFPSAVEENKLARAAIEAYFNSLKPTFMDKVIYKLKLLFK